MVLHGELLQYPLTLECYLCLDVHGLELCPPALEDTHPGIPGPVVKSRLHCRILGTLTPTCHSHQGLSLEAFSSLPGLLHFFLSVFLHSMGELWKIGRSSLKKYADKTGAG